MEIIRSIKDLQQHIAAVKKEERSVGFVPTMGYLHEGHLSLIKKAKETSDFVVLSIFVNPLQFGPNEDFDRYPRDFYRDHQLAIDSGVDVLFYPDVREMYPRSLANTVHVQRGVDVLCGKSRPGHFDGVATVVLKLFNIVQPTKAYFGMKDAQQVAVIENLVADFNIPIEIVKCETLREKDGLAKSSRNVYLSPTEREEAAHIFKSLTVAKRLIEAGEVKVNVIKDQILSHLKDHTSGVVDYVEVYSYPSLEEIETFDRSSFIIAVALQFEKARLIDNIVINYLKSGRKNHV